MVEKGKPEYQLFHFSLVFPQVSEEVNSYLKSDTDMKA